MIYVSSARGAFLHWPAAAEHFGALHIAVNNAAFVAFLASDDASFVTGSYHPVDGGYLSR